MVDTIQNIQTIEFCGELQGETDKAWFIFDGIETIPIPKSQVRSLRKLNDADAILEIPLWLAKKKGIV